MSWIDKIQNDLIITCGDGTQYFPTWINASFQKEYNIAEFNFPEISGTLVKRKKPLGRKFNLEMYFQGDDHLDVSKAFEKSADDERPWTIQHPFYDTINIQPASLSFDNSELNVTKISGTILETILEGNPKTSIAPVENIQQGVEEMDDLYDSAFTDPPTAADLKTALATNKKAFKKGVPIIELNGEFESYFNLFNSANSAISTAIATPLFFMRTIVTLIRYPSQFTTSVKNRFGQLVNQWDILKQTVEALFGVGGKQILQNQGAANIAAMCYASSTPLPGNYTNSVDVLFIIDKIVDTYADYLSTLDIIQSTNGGNPHYFIPNGDVLFKLNEIVNLTIANLFSIALGAKQERSVILQYDTNLISLTHRYYGLDPDDNNINEMIANNNFGLIHYLLIPKNTKITYHI